MRKPTRAREIALKTLYQIDLREEIDESGVTDLLAQEEMAADVRVHARTLVDGVRARQEEIDREIQDAAENWDLHRMPTIDRNVLRLGVYEIGWVDEVPPKVAINEAIELAKRYGSAESGAFVNGILDKIVSRRSV
ncbi:MAG: transcription antitermination factor NusB [Planctomycetota bacterium]|nr:transcription antitermination factor NusB [Planctomycetota bacterium]